MSEEVDNTPTFYTKPAIVRLARKSGIKILTDDAIPMIDRMLRQRVRELTNDSLAVLNARNARTLQAADVMEAIKMRGQIRTSGEHLALNKTESV